MDHIVGAIASKMRRAGPSILTKMPSFEWKDLFQATSGCIAAELKSAHCFYAFDSFAS